MEDATMAPAPAAATLLERIEHLARIEHTESVVPPNQHLPTTANPNVVDLNAPLALGDVAMVGVVDSPDADAAVYSKQYHPYIVAFAKSLFPDRGIHKNATFTPSSFNQVTPNIVRNYICERTYGKAIIGPNDKPINWRSSTAEMAKKAISFYMPQSGPSWNPANNSGNPTKSRVVNNQLTCMRYSMVKLKN